MMRKTYNRLFIRCGLTIAVLAVCITLLPVSEAGAEIERPLCKVCRRHIDKSPCSAQAYLDYDGRTRVVNACSLFCLFEQLEDFKGELKWVYVQNHDRRTDPEPLPIIAQRAWFVYGATPLEEPLSQDPWVYAFVSQKVADEFVEELGGEVLDWDAASERIKQLTDEYEPEKKEQRYRRNSYR